MSLLFNVSELVSQQPHELFKVWYDEASQHKDLDFIQTNAAALATSTPEGLPSCRMVLLRKFGMDGFVFLSSSSSRKGEELYKNPHAALTMYWHPLNRQVGIISVYKNMIAN